MARATQFDRQSSFAIYTSQYPGRAHPGILFDAEFNAVKIALDETQANLVLIQDDDGRLKRGSVGRAQLDSSITIGFEAPTAWQQNTAYEADLSTVFHLSIFYQCIETHVSGSTFDSSKWLAVADFTLQNTLNDGDVTGPKIANGAVSTTKLADEAVTTAKIDDEAVTTSRIGPLAVTTAKIAAAAVTHEKVDSTVWDTGDIKFTLKTTAPAGWRMFDDGTIGDASSSATSASAVNEDLFALIYDNISDTYAPLLTSAGDATTRSAQGTAAAAWAAHCRLSLPKTLGRALAIAGSGSGLSVRTLGQTAGAETVTVAQANLPNVDFVVTIGAGQGSHKHVIVNTYIASGPLTNGTGAVSYTAGPHETNLATLPAMSGTAASGGSGTALDKMQPTTFLNAMVKL